MNRFKILLFVAFFAALHAFILPVDLRAQGTANFPGAAQVNADYPDDAERYAAFNFLYVDFSRVARKPLSNDDYAKSFSYQASANAIMSQHMRSDGVGTQAYRDFNARCDQLFSDPSFSSSVLQKYNLPALPQRPRPSVAPNSAPPSATSPMYAPAVAPIAHNRPNSITGSQLLKHAGPLVISMMYDFPGVTFAIALLVFFLICSAVMMLAAWLVLRRSGVGRKIYPVPAPIPGGLPALPRNLQVVSLPGTRYAVYVLSGYILETSSQTHQQSFSSTTGGGFVQTPTGPIYNAPVTTSHTTTTVEQTIWVRQPNGIDAQWSIDNSNFQCRAGHLISVLVRQARDGGYVLLAYNHSMGALKWCAPLDESHAARGNELGQWAANIAGGIAAWQLMAWIMPSHDEGGLIAGFVVYWLVALHSDHQLVPHSHPHGQMAHRQGPQRPFSRQISSRLSPLLRTGHAHSPAYLPAAINLGIP